MVEKIQKVNVTVAGGYSPEVVNLKKGVPAEISFTRTNAQGCLAVVHSKDLDFERSHVKEENKIEDLSI